MRGFVLTLDVLIALQVLVFLMLFLFAPLSPAQEELLDVQLHREASDLLWLASKQGWLMNLNEAELENRLSELAGKPVYVNKDPGTAIICEKWVAAQNSTEGVNFKEITLCLSR